MRTFRLLIIASLATLAVVALAQAPALPQFSADYVITIKGGDKVQSEGKMYFGGQKMRMDANTANQQSHIIIDTPKQTTYILMPEQKMYMEMNMAKAAAGKQKMPDVKQYDPANPCANEPGVTCKKVESENVNGRSTDKWVFTGPHGDRNVWIDQKLHFPIRSVSADGSTTDYKNIKEGPQDPSLFEIPAGYQKFSMGGIGGMMRNIPK